MIAAVTTKSVARLLLTVRFMSKAETVFALVITFDRRELSGDERIERIPIQTSVPFEWRTMRINDAVLALNEDCTSFVYHFLIHTWGHPLRGTHQLND